MEHPQHTPQPAHLVELPAVQSMEQSMMTAQLKLCHEISQHDVTKNALATSQSTCQMWEVAYRQLEAQFTVTRDLLADSNAQIAELSTQIDSLEDTLKSLKPESSLPTFATVQATLSSSPPTCSPRLIAPAPSNTVMQIGALLAESAEYRRARTEQSQPAEDESPSPSHSV